VLGSLYRYYVGHWALSELYLIYIHGVSGVYFNVGYDSWD
jgi:hypothetical protein